MDNIKIEFIDTSQECIGLMTKYAKEGLKAGGKIVTKILKEDLKTNHHHTGGLAKAVVAWAKIDNKTGQPYMQVGYRSRSQMKKRGIKYFVNPYWLEFGVTPHQVSTKQFKKTGKSTYMLHNHLGQKFGFIANHPGVTNKNLLRNTVYNNIKEIREAQVESLGKITELQITKGLIVDSGGDEEID